MAKSKKFKKSSADAVYAKKAVAAKAANPFAKSGATAPGVARKMNPFEVHVNKEKFQILGRTCKHDRGLPGVSRAKAVKRRKETLGQEFRDKHKTNKFKDRRIGKNYSDGSELNEELLNARFVAEKMSQFKQNKMSRFNLNDDEVLTHRGQTLEEIEQFRDDRSDDDVDDDGLDADFTETAHFGGDNNQQKDRKTAIEEMIIDQKRRKAEIAKDKDELFDLTEKLDTNYKDLVGLMGKMTKNEMKVKPAADDYDKVLREMIFEPRGAVTDKLLSQEELAKQEKDRLEKLERERLARMRGDNEEGGAQQQPKHRSADDLDDGYFDYGEAEEMGPLTYNMDGELGTKLNGHVESEKEKLNGKKDDQETEESDDGSAEEKNSESEEDENEEEGNQSKETDDSEESDDEEDNLSDLKVTSSEDEADMEEVQKQPVSMKDKLKKTKNNVSECSEISQLPFTIEMPLDYQEFESLVRKHTPSDQATILERLIKCNHPKLEGVNREKIVHLFNFVLKYINELFVDASTEDVAESFKILAALNPLLYDLMHLNPERMSNLLLETIKLQHAEYSKNAKSFPTLDVFVIFKLVSNFFTTSDFRHPIVTPCFIFAQHILSRARVRSRQDIAMGLFLTTIILEYTQQSRRFLTAVWNYLLGVIFLALPKRPVEVLKIIPPFQSSGPFSNLLVIDKNPNTNDTQEELMNSEDLVTNVITTDFKIRALNTALKLIKDAISIAFDNIGVNYTAAQLLKMLERLPMEQYPQYVHKNYEEVKESLQAAATKKLTKIVPPEKKPKALRLLEPRFEAVYDDKRRPKMTKEKEEKAKLLHKLKRETKGAVREIRRDTEFLQKMRLKEQMKSDFERKEKVKRIYQEASVQQGELNELARAKKKKKF